MFRSENKSKHKLGTIFSSAFLLVLLWGCSQLGRNLPSTTIHAPANAQQAIDLAKLYCTETHSPPTEAEHNIVARLSTCKDINTVTNDPYICTNLPDTLDVWLVTMEGTWLHWGPPPASGTPTPTTFKQCIVVINAQTGEMISLSSK